MVSILSDAIFPIDNYHPSVLIDINIKYNNDNLHTTINNVKYDLKNANIVEIVSSFKLYRLEYCTSE